MPLIAHASGSSADGNIVQSSQFSQFTGTLIEVWVSYLAGTVPSLSDIFGNHYIPRTAYSDGVVVSQLFYCAGGLTGVANAVTVNCPGGDPAVVVQVFDGGPWIFASESGAGALASSLQPGSVSYPANSIVSTGLCVGSLGSESVDSSFNISDQLPGVASLAFGVAGAYLLPTAAGSVNPNWSLIPFGAAHMATGIAVFVVGGGPPPSVTCAIGTATISVPYSGQLTGSGGTGPYTYSISSGALPPGLTLNSLTGAITGTPNTPGTFGYEVVVSDSLGNQGHSLCFIAVSSPLAIVCPIGTATLAAPYSGTFSPSGGSPPYTVSILSGTFPPGLTITPYNGAITGFPTAAGVFNFVAQVVDSFGAVAVSPGCTITVVNLSLICPGTTGKVGVAYSSSLTAVGGTLPYTFSITSGALPPGLSLNSTTGLISGTPTTSTGSPFMFTAHVADSAGHNASVACSIAITNPSLSLTCASSAATAGVPYSSFLVAAGGKAPYTYSIVGGALPTGLSLNTSTGQISGTPSAGGTFPYTAQVNDSLSNSTKTGCSISVGLALKCATSFATLGIPYVSALVASGGTAPYAYSITSGTLPPGLSLNATTGAITGTPTAPGSYPYTAKVIDSVPNNVSVNCSIGVEGVPFSIGCVIEEAIGGAQYSAQVPAVGGAAPYGFVLSGGSLPPGLSLTSTGLITGIPTALGSFQYSVTATDADGNISSATCILTVGQGVPAFTLTRVTASLVPAKRLPVRGSST